MVQKTNQNNIFRLSFLHMALYLLHLISPEGPRVVALGENHPSPHFLEFMLTLRTGQFTLV